MDFRGRLAKTEVVTNFKGLQEIKLLIKSNFYPYYKIVSLYVLYVYQVENNLLEIYLKEP